MIDDLLLGRARRIAGEATDESLAEIGMELRGYLRPDLITTADHQIIEVSGFEAHEQTIGDLLKVPHGLVVDVALVVASVVPIESITAGAPGLRVHDLFAIRKFTQRRFKDQCVFTIDNRHTGPRGLAQQFDQWLEMKMRIDVEPRLWQLRRKIELAPEIVFAAGKDRLGMGSVTAQLVPYRGDTVQVGAQSLVVIALP